MLSKAGWRIVLLLAVLGISGLTLWVLRQRRTSKDIEGVLVEYGTDYFIYWLQGMEKRGVSRLQREGWRPVRWTPSGRYLVWIGPGKTDEPRKFKIGVSDPCGQTEPRTIVDLSDFSKWRLGSAENDWVNDELFLLSLVKKSPSGYMRAIWRVTVEGEVSKWLPGYELDHVLSPQVLLLWHGEADRSEFLTPYGFLPVPESYFVLNPAFLSPDGRWLLWSGDEDVFVGVFDPQQGVRWERKVASKDFFPLGWQHTPLRALALDSALDASGQEVFTFWAIDPQTGKRSRLLTLRGVDPKVLFDGLMPFLLSPDGQRVLAMLEESHQGWVTRSYVDIWHLATGERVTLVEKKGILIPLNWKRIDLSRCPNPPAIR